MATVMPHLLGASIVGCSSTELSARHRGRQVAPPTDRQDRRAAIARADYL